MLSSGGIQVGWGSQWETLADAINSYYGGGIESAQYQQVVQMLNSGEYTMEQMESVLGSIPEFNRTYNANGQLTSVSYNAAASGNTAAGSIANEINSNVGNATATQFRTVQNITKDAQTGKVTISDTVTKYNGGVASSAKAVIGSSISAICATSVGIATAKTVLGAVYNLDPEFFDDSKLWAINPQTWGSITAGENGVGAKLFNTVFRIDPNTGNPQAYLDQNTFAYMVAYMISRGAYDTGTAVVEPEYPDDLPSELTFPLPLSDTAIISKPSSGFYYAGACEYGGRMTTLILDEAENRVRPYLIVASESPDTKWGNYIGVDPTQIETNDPLDYHVTMHGKEFYYDATAFAWLPSNDFACLTPYRETDNFVVNDYVANIAYEMLYGDIVERGVDGIEPQAGQTQFDASGISDPSDINAVLAALMAQFPELWDERIEFSPDGENVYQYIPVGYPTGGTGTQPTTDGATKNDLSPNISGDGDNVTDELIKTLIDAIQNPQEQNGMESDTTTPTEPVDPNGDGTGSGNTPPFVIPVGSASALYSVYNPTQAQLNSLGAWLWSSNFVDQLLKLFNDPMQAIIGLHKIFATPSISGTGTIKVGYLDSGVGANLVGSQYTEVNCGKVKLSEYFKNVLDYTKTDVYLYLPFVGIVPLNVEDVMRANIEVKYKVDVLTGACLASVNVYRDSNAGGQLYVYAGNCAVQYPLSSGSYMGIISGILGIAGSVAGTMLSGGALLPMALGASASAMGNMKTKVEHSGSLSGNSGAMGIKKPYLIIRRPQTKIADNFALLNGVSNNVYGVLSSFTGQTRVKYVHLENIPATSEELTEIESYLKDGVLI